MADRKNGLRQHIKAAKDWLGRAESSLDKNNEVRGDLNLMLAKAELQRAQESKRSSGWILWFKRLTPVVLAVAVGFGYMTLLHDTGTKTIYVKTPASENGIQDRSDTAALQDAMLENSDNKATGDLNDKPLNEINDDQPIKGEQVSDENSDKVSIVTKEAASPVSGGGMNSADLHKLMQSAGKVLRE